MDVVGGHHLETARDGHLGQGVVASGVGGIAVVPQFHGHVVGTEGGPQRMQPARRRGRTGFGERGGHHPFAASGQHQPVPVVRGGQILEPAHRLPLFAPGQMGLRDGAAESGVPLGVARQHHQMGAVRVRSSGAARPGQRELGPEHRRQIEHGGGPGETDHAVQAVMVGEGEGAETEPDGTVHELLGVRRTV